MSAVVSLNSCLHCREDSMKWNIKHAKISLIFDTEIWKFVANFHKNLFISILFPIWHPIQFLISLAKTGALLWAQAECCLLQFSLNATKLVQATVFEGILCIHSMLDEVVKLNKIHASNSHTDSDKDTTQNMIKSQANNNYNVLFHALLVCAII